MNNHVYIGMLAQVAVPAPAADATKAAAEKKKKDNELRKLG